MPLTTSKNITNAFLVEIIGCPSIQETTYKTHIIYKWKICQGLIIQHLVHTAYRRHMPTKMDDWYSNNSNMKPGADTRNINLLARLTIIILNVHWNNPYHRE